jgi:hypothetical protein
MINSLRLTALLDVLRIAGWTTGERNSLVNGLTVDAAIERVQRAIDSL